MENRLYCGDNIEVLEKIEQESVDLIYIDPPFFSNRQYEVIWHDEAEIRSFEDRWEGGIENYIAWMRPRVSAMYKALKSTGSFYLHCDWHANAHLRIMMDEIFGRSNFRNEIIWQRTTHPKGSQFEAKKLGVATDSIFWYAKTDNYTFNLKEIKRKLTPEEITIKYPKIDNNGRYCVAPIIRSASMGERPNLVYEYKGYKSDVYGWRMTKEKLIELDKKGNLGWTKNKAPFRKLRTEDDEGEPMYNLWTDIPRAGTGEILGYPTQKPEALLERIIKASSNEGDVVLDAFCGCGTAMAVAHKLNRKWIGIDISPTAIKLVEKRLKKAGAVKEEHYKTIGLPATEDDLRKLKPFEFQNWVMDEMGASVSRRKVGDMGIDGCLEKTLYHDRAGIQVKQSDGVGRNVVDNFMSALKRAKYKEGYIVAFSFTKGSYEEVARLKNTGELEIKLITVRELLDKRRSLVK